MCMFLFVINDPETVIDRLSHVSVCVCMCVLYRLHGSLKPALPGGGCLPWKEKRAESSPSSISGTCEQIVEVDGTGEEEGEREEESSFLSTSVLRLFRRAALPTIADIA